MKNTGSSDEGWGILHNDRRTAKSLSGIAPGFSRFVQTGYQSPAAPFGVYGRRSTNEQIFYGAQYKGCGIFRQEAIMWLNKKAS